MQNASGGLGSFAPLGTADSCTDYSRVTSVAVGLEGGACGDLAVSAQGPGSGGRTGISAFGDATGIEGLAASATGNAEGSVAATIQGDAWGGVAVSGTGASHGVFVALDAMGPSRSDTVLAASAAGPASAPIAALSGLGASHALAAASLTGPATGTQVAVSGLGDSHAESTPDFAILALSATGNASCANSENCFAISATGHASTDSCEVAACAVSGCDMAAAAGTDALCVDPIV
jgi:hypothetical protein